MVRQDTNKIFNLNNWGPPPEIHRLDSNGSESDTDEACDPNCILSLDNTTPNLAYNPDNLGHHGGWIQQTNSPPGGKLLSLLGDPDPWLPALSPLTPSASSSNVVEDSSESPSDMGDDGQNEGAGMGMGAALADEIKNSATSLGVDGRDRNSLDELVRLSSPGREGSLLPTGEEGGPCRETSSSLRRCCWRSCRSAVRVSSPEPMMI